MIITVKEKFTVYLWLSPGNLGVMTGILIYGPMGTGKSMIGRALENEGKYSVIYIQGPEIFSKFFGETEENLKKKFAQAEAK